MIDRLGISIQHLYRFSINAVFPNFSGFNPLMVVNDFMCKRADECG